MYHGVLTPLGLQSVTNTNLNTALQKQEAPDRISHSRVKRLAVGRLYAVCDEMRDVFNALVAIRVSAGPALFS